MYIDFSEYLWRDESREAKPRQGTPDEIWRGLYFCFLCFAVLGIEHRCLYLQHRCSPWATHPILLFFGHGLTLLPGLASDCDPPTSTSQIAGITDGCHHAWLASVLLTFTWADLEGVFLFVSFSYFSFLPHLNFLESSFQWLKPESALWEDKWSV
jgi:hypothetical protein